MAWTIEYDPRVIRDLQKLPRPVRADIVAYLDTRITRPASPRDFGKPLRHEKFGLWRYHMSNDRIMCDIPDRVRNVCMASLYGAGRSAKSYWMPFGSNSEMAIRQNYANGPSARKLSGRTLSLTVS